MASLVHDLLTRAGRKIVVIDYAISEEMAKALYEYFHYYVEWGFDANEENAGDNVQFIHAMDNHLIQKSPVWNQLRKYVDKFFGKGYIPYNCSVNHTRFGDNPMDHRDTDNERAKDITLLLYLNPHWNMNFSGETVYFDERGEIELAVLPKFCRVAIHEGYVRHSSRPPARVFESSRYTLAIKAAPEQCYRERRIDADNQPNQDGLRRKAFLEEQIFGTALN